MNAPVFAHGQMRLYLLMLLADSPKHGYELMTAIEQRFNGTYVPSAGTIYPRLAKLAEDGLIAKRTVGRKTVYEITDAGRAELRARRDETERIERTIDTSVRRLADDLRADMRRSMAALRADMTADERDIARARRSAGPAPRAADAASGPLREGQRVVERYGRELREALRAADAAGSLDDAAVDALREGLDRLARTLRDRTRRPR